MNTRAPAEVFPPGEFIRDELEARGWTQADLAKIMDRPVSALNLIIAGKKGITADTALELAGAFDTSPEYWLNLENAYKLSKVTVPFQQIREKAVLYDSAPIKEMQKRHWIQTTDSVIDLKRELTTFYGRFNRDELKMAARASTEQGIITSEQLAWAVKCLELADTLKVSPFIEDRVIGCEKALRQLAAHVESIRKVPEVLGQAGIRFVIVEHLKGSKIDGAALWLGDQWDKPVIALSLRYDRIDSFWHTLFHELSHIRHKDSVVDIDLQGDTKTPCAIKDIEDRANTEASESLVPGSTLDSFIQRKKPAFSKTSIFQFANLHKIHPGIVVGQIQHVTGAYSLHRDLLVKVRDIVTSSALTDGWSQT